MDRKTVRKQNRVLFEATETYGLINQHTVLVNSPNLVADKSKHNMSARELRFDVIRVWFGKCRIAIGTTSIHYPFTAATNILGVTSIIHSPRKGTHKPVKINVERPKKQLRCRECSAHAANAVILNGLSHSSECLLSATVGIHSTRDVYLTCQAAKAPG